MRGTCRSLGCLVLAMASLGCAGIAGPSDADQTYSFAASAVVNPTQPEAGRRITLNIELTSACSQAV